MENRASLANNTCGSFRAAVKVARRDGGTYARGAHINRPKMRIRLRAYLRKRYGHVLACSLIADEFGIPERQVRRIVYGVS